jgi:hypothetical protein
MFVTGRLAIGRCPQETDDAVIVEVRAPRPLLSDCEHKGYMFRARKNVEVPDGQFVETKYRCRSCSHKWWERIPAPPGPKQSDEAA